MKKRTIQLQLLAAAFATVFVAENVTNSLTAIPTTVHAEELSTESRNNNSSTDGSAEPEKAITQKSVHLSVGGTTSSQGISWYADSNLAGEIQYAVKSGDNFPEKYETVSATSTTTSERGWYSNQAVLTNLEPDTDYVYRLKNGNTVSETYQFHTGDTDGSYEFAFVGDPQLGANYFSSSKEDWLDTLNKISENTSADFLLSAGDQVNNANFENQYEDYIAPVFSSLPSATTIGNHDDSSTYGTHFNMPNESADKGQTDAGTDYWFVYENTLFMDLNSNDLSTAEHKAFMEEAIAANPNVKWKTVVFHHSIFSTASHYADDEIISRRNEFPPIFKELGIDVVLMGHDHVYTRTYMMDGNVPDTSNGVQSSVTDPSGILYLTANSASGSKYYDIAAPDAEYSAIMDQSKRRTFTDIKVTDTSYSMTTYFADDMSVLDEFTIYKTEAPIETDTTELSKYVEELNQLNLDQADYTEESWAIFALAFDHAKDILDDASATQDDIDKALADLKSAKENLVKQTPDGGDGDSEDHNNGNSNNNSNNNNTNNNTNGNSHNNTVSNSPAAVQTGDSTFLGSVMLLLAASLFTVIVTIFKRRSTSK